MLECCKATLTDPVQHFLRARRIWQGSPGMPGGLRLSARRVTRVLVMEFAHLNHPRQRVNNSCNELIHGGSLSLTIR